MTDKEIFCEDLLNHGQSASLVTIAGDACPCMAFGHPGEYSAAWHRLNSEEDDCNGTGIVSEELTTTGIKAYIFPAGAAVGNRQMVQEVLEAIGEVLKDDLLLYGSANSTTGAFVSLTSVSQEEDYIIYNSKYYTVHSVYELMTDSVVGEWAILRRTVTDVLHTA